jgi:IS1 family transposase
VGKIPKVHAKDKIFTNHAWVNRLKKENASLRNELKAAEKKIDLMEKQIKLIKELIALLQ